MTYICTRFGVILRKKKPLSDVDCEFNFLRKNIDNSNDGTTISRRTERGGLQSVDRRSRLVNTICKGYVEK